jgi:AcrR family transcriptional regulator
MCPAPARTSDAALIQAARTLLERDGAEGVTMQKVGAVVGVSGPSLYNRFASRDALLRAVENAVLAEFAAELRAAAGGGHRKALARMAAVYRGFARQSPNAYALIFAPPTWDEARVAARAMLAEPLLTITHRMVGPTAALPAARLLTALLHGWASMELSGAFGFGGDLEAAFDYALEAAIAGIENGRPAQDLG